MQLKIKIALVACGCSVLLAGSAQATFIGALPTDPNGLGGFQGSVTMTQTVGSQLLLAKVEYAVYAPGQFSSSAALGNPVDPSAGQDYVYAYEIFNSLTATLNVQTLTVNIDYPNFPNAVPVPGSFVGNVVGPDPPGVAPNATRFSPTSGQPKHSVLFNYTTTTLGPGQHSTILYFASPFAPHYVISSIAGGQSSGDSDLLPSPIPEPSGWILMAIGGIALASLRRRRMVGVHAPRANLTTQNNEFQ